MSDLALPMLVLFDDDALAFWCFAALMRTFGARSNFAVDESGIFSQLRGLAGVLGRADRVLAHKLTALGAGECHFAYRMVVVLMRRDLPLGQAMTLWELMWADARRQLAARRRRRAARDAAAPPLIAAAADEEEDPKAALKRRDAAGAGAGGAPPSAGGAAGPGDDADFLSTAASGFFVHFVAAVVVGARRRVLDECRDADDAMRLFHTLKGIDLWECVTRATVLRAAGAGRKQR
ncbi:hypothetical protein Rsub_10207 [Raphidocelis subcapitata]|uniref:Rab-GAP TBC domain-containing protein n=1 Tax=Raphidocelis subcapitata TaxID=307507 RepID=A0A2V0PFK4_9CHLO|nr:hypothetical protein Rsub_10207 [Raphidocelis subcapitata]|eukprot:GBF97782.1 hypothetical protein Rsub_10207 [Raphidocelis subcapitata]